MQTGGIPGSPGGGKEPNNSEHLQYSWTARYALTCTNSWEGPVCLSVAISHHRDASICTEAGGFHWVSTQKTSQDSCQIDK